MVGNFETNSIDCEFVFWAVKLIRRKVSLFRRSQIAGVPDRWGSGTAEPPVSLWGGGEQFWKFWPDGDTPKLIRSIVSLFLGS